MPRRVEISRFDDLFVFHWLPYNMQLILPRLRDSGSTLKIGSDYPLKYVEYFCYYILYSYLLNTELFSFVLYYGYKHYIWSP